MIWGHSTLVGPVWIFFNFILKYYIQQLVLIWFFIFPVKQLGEIIATSGHEETILIAEIDHSASQLAR